MNEEILVPVIDQALLIFAETLRASVMNCLRSLASKIVYRKDRFFAILLFLAYTE